MENLETDEFLELKISYAHQAIGRLDFVENILLEIEKEDNELELTTYVRQLMAEFHSIKGNSGALQFDAIKIICHKVEDVTLAEGARGIKSRIELLLRYVDIIKEYFSKFVDDRTLDESAFILKHREIFENLIYNKKNKNEVEAELVKLNVLVLGMPASLIKTIKKLVPNIDFQVSFAGSAVNAIERFSKEKFDLILSSFFIEPINGIALCAALKTQWPLSKAKFVLLPSQEIDSKSKDLLGHLIPDAIILKDANFHENLSSFINSTFCKNREVKKIICFDDEESILSLYKLSFEDLSSTKVLYINKEAELQKKIEEYLPDLIISDVHLNKLNIKELFLKYKDQMDFVFITGDNKSHEALSLKKEGAMAIWDKSEVMIDLTLYLNKLGYKIS